MKILLWIQGWSGQLNVWAWHKWDKLHRQDWLKGYKKWKKDEQNLYNCLYGARTNSATLALHAGGGSMIWLLLFIVVSGYLVADYQNIIMELKRLWKRIK